MDIQGIINIGLAVPFLAVLTILSIVFLRTGYKKGLWHSLISFGATLAALATSMLLGNLFGDIFAETAYKFASGVLMSGEAISSMLESVIRAILQVFMTLLFFSLFLVISVPVLKHLAKKLPWKKLSEDPGSNKKLRFAGLGIRALDAVVLTFLLLMPLYGSLAATLPTVSLFVGQASQAGFVLNQVAEHPMVAVYRSGPASAIYQGISGFDFGGESFDLVEITDTAEGVTLRMEAIASAEDEEELVEAASDLARYLRSDVIEEDWTYELFVASLEEIKQEDSTVAQEMYDLLYMSKEEFQSNGGAILDFLDYAIHNGFVEFMQAEDFACLDDDFYQHVGDLINHSDKAIALKKMLMVESAVTLFDIDQDNRITMAQAAFFVNQYIPDQPTEAGLRRQEGEMFMRMYFSTEKCDTVAAFAYHPALGYDRTKDLLSNYVLQCTVDFDTSLIYDPQVVALLQSKLALFAQEASQGYSFHNYAYAVCSLGEMLRGGENSRSFGATDALLEDLLQDLDDSFFQSSTLDGQKVRTLLEQALEEARQTPGELGSVYLYGAYTGEPGPIFEPYSQQISYGDDALILPAG